MKKHIQFVAGVAVGALLFGGGAALAAELTAKPSTQTFYLNGEQVRMEAYDIADHNYVKLRDVGKLVGFNVSWRAADNAVLIETDEPHSDESATHPAANQTADYAAEANQDVFTDELTRKVYNAIRDAVVHRDAIPGGSAKPVSMGAIERYGAVDEASGAIGGYPVYEIIDIGNGEYACSVKRPETYAAAADHTQPFVDSLTGMEQEQQVREIAWYVCDRLTYQMKYTDVSDILASDEVKGGSCMSYAYCFRFLCDRAGIPCILVRSDIHQWNEVYVDGRWWSVDLTGADMGNDTSHRASQVILHDRSEMQGSDYMDAAPNVTLFAKELLVPGSTK